jgi:hypothetical protein
MFPCSFGYANESRVGQATDGEREKKGRPRQRQQGNPRGDVARRRKLVSTRASVAAVRLAASFNMRAGPGRAREEFMRVDGMERVTAHPNETVRPCRCYKLARDPE